MNEETPDIQVFVKDFFFFLILTRHSIVRGSEL